MTFVQEFSFLQNWLMEWNATANYFLKTKLKKQKIENLYLGRLTVLGREFLHYYRELVSGDKRK
jgi:hypothetical protein